MEDNKIIAEGDERILGEANWIYARLYFFMLACVFAGAVVQLLFSRSVLGFLPGIVGGLGSLGFFLYKYRCEGLLFSRESDERIDALRVEIKSKCFLFCMYVHVLGAMPLLFFDVPMVAMWAIIFSWFIPTVIAVVQIGWRGLYASGSKAKEKEDYKDLRIRTFFSALFFGGFMSFLQGLSEFRGIVHHVLLALGMALFWGVFFYLAMVGVDKLSAKFAEKRLEKMEQTDNDEE